MHRLILLMNCPDKKGIIAHITNFIHDRKGNIVYIDHVKKNHIAKIVLMDMKMK